MITIQQAAARIDAELTRRVSDGKSGFVTGFDFVLCEDFETVMIYVDTTDERDALASCFDLGDDDRFDPQTFLSQLQPSGGLQ